MHMLPALRLMIGHASAVCRRCVLTPLVQGRKRARDEGGMATISGGMPQAAAAAAAATAAGVQQSRLVENFYRFQQREQRRTGESLASESPVCCAQQ
jgi:hypothetical protein